MACHMKFLPESGHYWLYGIHAVQAALDNPKRVKRRMLCTAPTIGKLQIPKHQKPLQLESKELARLLGEQTVHQGCALEVQPLPQPSLETAAEQSTCLLMLDQVSDPHNIGAMLRSAAAFGAGGIIMQDKHAPKENATIAKIAAGGLEHVPLIKVTNLTRALESLREFDFWSIGLDGEAQNLLSTLSAPEKKVIVMGSEGKGLRPLVAKSCDYMAKLPIHRQMESLNVSVAAGIALYALCA